ncbi:MAG: universal stress protein [Candidatus Rokubacteria bacterium]|nr:universal stress protein [Betaproteobacteria bacterium]MBM4441085.1 universal stress protein [Candidatus Rokubacteria bacterium]
MFKHLLLPTDGSRLSAKAAAKAVRLAKALGARITAVHVVPKFQAVYVEDTYFMLPVSEARFRRETKRRAARYLQQVAAAARKAGVRCEGVTVEASQPYRGIIRTAKARKCDCIVMASHGRRGISALLLGSEASKVLTHSAVPVVVFR